MSVNASPPPTTLSVLIVDDQEPARILLRAYLIRLGYTVIEEASDSIEAMRLLMSAEQDQRPYSLVMIDRSMPEMNGLEFVRAMRQLTRFRKFPIIVLSEELDPITWKEVLDAGANEHVLKPVTEESVIAAIARALPPERQKSE